MPVKFLGEAELDEFVCQLYYDMSHEQGEKGAIIRRDLFKNWFTGEISLIAETIYKVYEYPQNISNVKETNKLWLMDILDKILTHQIPTPIQVKYLQNYSKQPNNLLTQSVLNTCENNDCICPLLFSPLACPEFVMDAIIPTYKRFTKKIPKKLSQLKCVQRMISTLRQLTTYEEFLGWLQRLELSTQQAEIIGLVEYK